MKYFSQIKPKAQRTQYSMNDAYDGTSSRCEKGCALDAVFPTVECTGHGACISRSGGGLNCEACSAAMHQTQVERSTIYRASMLSMWSF